MTGGADHPIDLGRAWLMLGAVALGMLALSLRDRSVYQRFKALTDSTQRIRHFRRWVIAAFLTFGVAGLVMLWVIGRLADILHMPPEFAPGADLLSGGLPARGLFGAAYGVTFIVLLLIVTALRARRGQAPRPGAAGDVMALLARNGAERWWLILLSLNAGVTEEIFFRLLVPLLLCAVTGSIIVALLGGCLVFGLIHAYQGVRGIVATSVLGGIFTVIYVGTGSLVFAMATHVIVDLNTLVFLPWLRARAAARSARP